MSTLAGLRSPCTRSRSCTRASARPRSRGGDAELIGPAAAALTGAGRVDGAAEDAFHEAERAAEATGFGAQIGGEHQRVDGARRGEQGEPSVELAALGAQPGGDDAQR